MAREGLKRFDPRVRLRRRYRFSASHLYRRPDWSDEENRRRFGKCANLPGHGHNYRVTVVVAGDPHPDTGFVIDLGWLDALVRDAVLEALDHQHLNSAVLEFAPGGRIPSSENLVLWIRDRLLAGWTGQAARLVQVAVDEDEDLGAEWHSANDTP